MIDHAGIEGDRDTNKEKELRIVYCNKDVVYFLCLQPSPEWAPSQQSVRFIVATRYLVQWALFSTVCRKIRNLYQISLIHRGL